ncbi:MAG: acyl--CoA ligase [Thiohalocapsa sp.]|uniref:class I adenylate-forming enzyme family protein n=1 Tax=Thiohalocapsa sp. TaxID=2497641 RepID=UPI0025DA01E6|nr:class I adenylate-forming enzyme family protein [Thiohalocapsa sp.]MCG6940399.1 acyl--CoA ligase [Thiohalocapsa sp.]
MLSEPALLTRLLDRGLGDRPEVPALVSATTSMSWRALDAASNRCAASLLDLGLQKGDRVASLMPNRTALIVHYLACIKAGLVATPLNYRYTAPEIDHALDVSGASVLLAHAERHEDVARSRLAGDLPLGVIEYGNADGRGMSFESLLERESAGFSPAALAPDDPAVIFFTSGSTGKPKGVTHTAESLGWMLASAAAGIGLGAVDVMLPGSSLSHVAGFVWSMTALSVGARLVVPRTLDGDELLPLFRSQRPTVLSILPSTLFTLVRDHNATHEDFGSLRLCRAAGDKVASELEREFMALAGFPIDEGYGMTEIGFALITPPSGPFKLGSVGRPMPGFTMLIRDEAGAEVPTGTEGCIWVRSRSCMSGYWNDKAATEAAIRDGWLDTGDEMTADADGYLWFHGRKKQMIVHDGSNICPQEVEDALLAHPAVENAGVVGVHDLLHGENVRAYVTLKQGAPRPTVQEMIRLARSQVGYKAPEEIIILDEIPLNPTGKVDRIALKQLADVHLAGASSA